MINNFVSAFSKNQKEIISFHAHKRGQVFHEPIVICNEILKTPET